MTFHWDHHAPKKIGILCDMRICGNPSWTNYIFIKD
jgi:hypothetical protein